MSLTLAEKRKSLITSFFILVTYVLLFHLSALVLLIPPIGEFVSGLIDRPADEKSALLIGWWSFGAGIVALVVIFILATVDKKYFDIFEGKKASVSESIGWGILGFFMVLFGQYIGVYIELAIGIDPGSENTADLMAIAKLSPIMIIVIALIGPILEEFVFRRVVFGSMIQFQNFWISAIISALVFAAIHFDFTHIILYTICGLIFAFLYYKTKRLLTSIVAHILLNSFVAAAPFILEKLKPFLEQMQ